MMTLTTALQPLEVIEDLKRDWESLEQRAVPNVFLSWGWVETWIRQFKPAVQILTVYNNRYLVGLGLLVEKRERVLNCPVNVFYLQRTGDEKQDQIWIEYNDFLIDQSLRTEVRQSITQFFDQRKGCDKLVIGVSDDEMLDSLPWEVKRARDSWSEPSFGVDLLTLKSTTDSYIESLSKNTRYQVRRTEKKLKDEHGEVILKHAEDEAQAMEMFDCLGKWHIQRWGGENGRSGFLNPQFVAFHRNLVQTLWQTGAAELLCLYAGEKPIAYLYNFVWHGRVSFYLGAYESVGKNLQPGLLCHVLTIQHHLDRGATYYDFMGGDMRYKRSLGEENERLVMREYYRPDHPSLWLQEKLRMLKGSILRG